MMDFAFFENGTLTLSSDGKRKISPSPVGQISLAGKLCAPDKLTCTADTITLFFGEMRVVLSYRYRKNGSLRLEVREIPDAVDHYVFGPYACPDTVECGEWLGAAWAQDGSAVCIQSLNPKTVGENAPGGSAAVLRDGTGYLSCSADNMSRPKIIPRLYGDNFENVTAAPVEGPDAYITGAAVVLTCAASGKDLLSDIGSLETEEGLPHPTVDGEWAKTSKKTKGYYLVFGGGDINTQIRMAERAGARCIYFSDPFRSWGHFDINPDLYPGGKEEFCRMMEHAREHGVNVGFHTLSNFIHGHDPYVSPVPHKELLAFDPTPLLSDISDADTEIPLSEKLNYGVYTTVRAARIGDEIIRFAGWDEEKHALTGCQRGYFGTTACSHKAGETVTRLADHGYGTLFPTLKLQGELADRISTLIRDAGIRRMSFDGMEGCFYPGRGEYGASEYVRRVFAQTDGELLCDASGCTHYRWHAHSYLNWGEPWCDSGLRGGMFNYRARNQDLFDRNLMPRMLGWYRISPSNGRFEGTSPETMESYLASSVGFNAGLCINIQCAESDYLNMLLDKIRDWQEFRDTVDVPEDLREKMRIEGSDWHLEKRKDKWILTELVIRQHDLGFTEKRLITESGTTGWVSEEEAAEYPDAVSHHSVVVIDRSATDRYMKDVTEPLYCRIRVGNKMNHGKLHDLAFYEGWHGHEKYLSFRVEANAGDYLIYHGGTKLYHCDPDFNLLEICEGDGKELIVNGTWLCGYTLHYATVGDDMVIMFTHFRTHKTYEFPIT